MCFLQIATILNILVADGDFREIQTKTEFNKKYLFKIYISFIKKYITKAWQFRRKI